MVACSWFYTVTGYAFLGKGFAEVAETCRAAGISGIECAPPLVEGLAEGELVRAASDFRAAGLRIPSFHLPFEANLDVASFYRTQRRKTVETLKSWIARAAAVGADVAILHPSTSQHDAEIEGVDRYLGALGESLESLLPFAASNAVIIALENMLPREGARFCSRPEHFVRIHRELAHPNLGFCLDTGHALIAGGPQGAHGFFEAMQKALVAFHLSDTAGDRDIHIAPGRGLVDWGRLFGAAAQIGYARAMCIETSPFAHAVSQSFSTEAWRELLEGTAKLAQAALGPGKR